MADTHGYDMEFSKHLDMFDDSASKGRRGASDWAVPWSDLMMVMFVLFVVLYVYATQNKDVMLIFTDRTPPASTRQSSAALDGIIAGFEQRTQDGMIGEPDGSRTEVLYKSRMTGVSVTRKGDQVHVVLRGPDFFEQGTTEIRPDTVAYLTEVAELMRVTNGEIQVIGFADASEPQGADGFSFSARRASAIAAWFIGQTEIDAARFSVTGRGEYEPEVPATANNPDDINRRVEIVIHTGS